MKVLFLNDTLNFPLVPRNYPLITDILVLSLRNEMTDLVILPTFTFDIINKEVVITITDQPTDFKSQNKYEISLTKGNDIVYLGKMLILDIGTNIQNYEYGTQTNTKFKYA